MTRLLSFLILSTACLGFSATAALPDCCDTKPVQSYLVGAAQKDAKDKDHPMPMGVRKLTTKAGKTYFTGRKEPKNLAALHVAAFKRLGDKIGKLPKATAATFDCRPLGIVGPIQDQGQCGSCWDFSGTTVATSAGYKAGQFKNDGTNYLSQQYVLDCLQTGGCNGDDNTTVLIAAKSTGLPMQAAYGPYTASVGTCKYTSSMPLFKLQDWGFCTPSQQQGVAATQDIKNAMVQYGPIGSAIAADDNFVNYQAGTVFTGNSTDINHDIVLVGWDDSKGGTGAWLLENSWGTSWGGDGAGNGGYMWIAYGANSVGTEAVWATAGTSPGPGPGGGPTGNLNANPPSINAGQSSTLTWTSTGGMIATLNGALVALSGSQVVSPTATTTYTFTVTDMTGASATSTAVVTVGSGPTPPPPSGSLGSVTLAQPYGNYPAGSTFNLAAPGSAVLSPATKAAILNDLGFPNPMKVKK